MYLHGAECRFGLDWGGFERAENRNLMLVGMEGGSSEDQDSSERKKKRYHRHTARQIQELETVFKECPHPDEKQRLQLSRELGLEPRQIKFWFQNRRTQMKAQHERQDNCALRSENDKIRCENIAIREALRNVICPNCGGPPTSDDMYFNEQKLLMENARLKEELDRVSSLAAKYIGRPIPQLPPVPPIPISSLDLTVGSFGGHQQGIGVGPSLDLDLLSGSSLVSLPPPPPLQPMHSSGGIGEVEKSIMMELASNSMEEFVRIAQGEDTLWMKSPDGKEILNLENYARIFPRASNSKTPDLRIEATRDSGLVIMNGLAVVDMLVDANKWSEMFPTIISRARTVEVLSHGMTGSHNGFLQLMYAELQVLSPLVQTREFYFIRYCQQHAPGTWAVVDVSVDYSRENPITSPLRCRKLPSGCLIQDMPNGYSKVSWIEHVEVEEKTLINRIYRDFVYGGHAFGAQRWFATLQRMCERYASLMLNSISSRELGVIPSPDGRRSMMKLTQRMINHFCTSISASTIHRWTTLSGVNDDGVRISTHKSTDPGQPNGVVLSAATSLWLPVSPQNVFNFFRDERTRAQWDVLNSGNSVQEVAHIANGSHPGNCISLLRAFNASQNHMLILQESCTDASGSLVVYAPIDVPSVNIAMSGEDPSYIPLLPSGFTISPDGRQPDQTRNASTSSGGGNESGGGDSGGGGGSIITVAFQILVSSLPSAKLNLESVTTVNNLINTTVQQIKTALNCPAP